MKWIVGLIALVLATAAQGQEISISAGKGKKAVVTKDFKAVPTTPLLLRPSDLKPEDVKLFCSTSLSAVVAEIKGQWIAIDSEAAKAITPKAKITADGAAIKIIKADDPASPLKAFPEVVTKLQQRADRECEPVREPDLSVPSTPLAKGPGNSVETAYFICAAVDSAGFASKPCEVSGWNSAIRITMDARGAEARILCKQMVGMARKQGLRFGPDWKIEIYSPFSDGNTIAYCRL